MMPLKSAHRKIPLQSSVAPNHDYNCATALDGGSATDGTVGLDKSATNSKAQSTQSPVKNLAEKTSDSKSEGTNNDGKQQALSSKGNDAKHDAPVDNGPANKGSVSKGPANKGPVSKGSANKGPDNKGPDNKSSVNKAPAKTPERTFEDAMDICWMEPSLM